MRDAVIVEAVRTPLGKRNGGLSGVHPADLSAHVLEALAERTGIDPAQVDDVIWGCVTPGRRAGLRTSPAPPCSPAGWPESVPGATIDRQCGSSPAVGALRRCRPDRRPVRRRRRRRRRVDDAACRWAPRSHGADPFGPRRSRPATAASPEPGHRRGDDRRALGLLRAPSSTSSRSPRTPERPPRRRTPARSTRRSCRSRPTPTATCSAGRGHPPGRHASRPGRLKTGLQARTASITAGNASQISDGAAALLMTTRRRRRQLGLTPIARVHTAVLAGDDPVIMLTAPDPGHPARRWPASGLPHRRHRRVRGQRGLRARAAGLAERDRRRRQGRSTRTAARSRSATRSAAPAPGS